MVVDVCVIRPLRGLDTTFLLKLLFSSLSIGDDTGCVATSVECFESRFDDWGFSCLKAVFTILLEPFTLLNEALDAILLPSLKSEVLADCFILLPQSSWLLLSLWKFEGAGCWRTDS